jgi:hypothetical protein
MGKKPVWILYFWEVGCFKGLSEIIFLYIYFYLFISLAKDKRYFESW